MKLKQIRLSKDLTIPKLALLSGVPIRTIENIERKNNAEVKTIIKLAKALNVTLDELCLDEEEE